MEKLIELINVNKIYKMGDIPTTALNNINLCINRGEILVIIGSSGGGKTTLLNVMSGLDNATSGTILFKGKNISKYKDSKLTKFRKENLGFIFQTYNLLEHLNVYENVLVGAKLSRNKDSVEDIITTMGLKKHVKKYMHELSGGEQQRVSIARALAKKPEVMFCDEPTGALDEVTGKIVLKSLVDANVKYKTTMVIVTHNPGISLIGDRIIHINSGIIIEDIVNKKRTDPMEIPWG